MLTFVFMMETLVRRFASYDRDHQPRIASKHRLVRRLYKNPGQSSSKWTGSNLSLRSALCGVQRVLGQNWVLYQGFLVAQL